MNLVSFGHNSKALMIYFMSCPFYFVVLGLPKKKIQTVIKTEKHIGKKESHVVSVNSSTFTRHGNRAVNIGKLNANFSRTLFI